MELKTQERSVLGKKVKNLRASGLIPAELYGKGIENKHLSVGSRDFMKIFKEAGENTVVTLTIDGKEKFPVIISDAHFDHLKDEVTTVDFHKINMDEKIEAEIPVELTGEAPAIKKGLIVVKVMNEIKVSATPAHLPHKFEIDVGGLADEGNAIHVKDLNIGKEVKVITPENSVIVIVNKMKEEKEETPPPAPEAAPAETTQGAETGTEENK
jgi:large subunit ribosomal protein L25